jgi:hypothetical protein
VKHGFNETKKRSKEKYPEGGVCRKKKTDNRTSAKICAVCTGQESLVRGWKGSKGPTQRLKNFGDHEV